VSTRFPSPAAAHSSLRAGIGLRAQHHADIVARKPAVGWFEAHSENYFASGGAQRSYLEKIRADYALSLHGVGLSIGSTDPLNRAHLEQIVRLVHDFEPMLVSEHLSWSSVGGRFTNDQLPQPYTDEALHHMITRVRDVQDVLGRQILIENVSSYLQFTCSPIPEWDFLTFLAEESGCGILLDVNNVYVNARNHRFDAHTYVNALPRSAVKEIHLAGHTARRIGQQEILIDTHNRPVCEAVWELYVTAVARYSGVPVLIEWDADIPALEVLVAEARKADAIAGVAHVAAA
jgi:uncharacterized protein (UPF0276 family)